ncbi:unnamed protein product [Euphydryas editha]|uniref:Uncharacterized protein n=1 Tax=Euphydryas editha TaxID=104508 RepID=A0AAU9UCN2_EUPED|nr:unnamed protein product [Euphydryas editha]
MYLVQRGPTRYGTRIRRKRKEVSWLSAALGGTLAAALSARRSVPREKPFAAHVMCPTSAARSRRSLSALLPRGGRRRGRSGLGSSEAHAVAARERSGRTFRRKKLTFSLDDSNLIIGSRGSLPRGALCCAGVAAREVIHCR